MSSVVSGASKDSHYTDLSRISGKVSGISGYSRGKSAYSQNRKEALDSEKIKLKEELLQKHIAESEKHKKLMRENLQRQK